MVSTVTSPQDLRLEKLFKATDSNNDGYLEWADYERLIDRYITGLQLDRESRQAYGLRAAHQMFWLELLRYANGQNRLSQDDYIHAVRSLLMDVSRFNLAEGLPHSIFDAIDRDGDNEIDKEEFDRYLKAWGTKPADGAEVFSRLDTDGDGRVSRWEFIRSWREFFFSDSSDAAGVFYLGAV
ncbi:EF-hand domain-containing protein [Frankia sp. AgB32]|uniref:EF-hand domain-containing protein n=1 Tax=Frankia sp. AgB32 TaxID=631119 RepID=UPI00200FB698|nr:EF-hand domain-containing protein [Frankia sp. AgB32]MCK9898240.1 EF-hand domain-containing protein [Frankia sp. AgB32]